MVALRAWCVRVALAGLLAVALAAAVSSAGSPVKVGITTALKPTVESPPPLEVGAGEETADAHLPAAGAIGGAVLAVALGAGALGIHLKSLRTGGRR